MQEGKMQEGKMQEGKMQESEMPWRPRAGRAGWSGSRNCDEREQDVSPAPIGGLTSGCGGTGLPIGGVLKAPPEMAPTGKP